MRDVLLLVLLVCLLAGHASAAMFLTRGTDQATSLAQVSHVPPGV